MNTQIFESLTSNNIKTRNSRKSMDTTPSPTQLIRENEINDSFDKPPVSEVNKKVLKTRKSSKMTSPEEVPIKLQTEEQAPLLLEIPSIEISRINVESSDSPTPSVKTAVTNKNVPNNKRFIQAVCPSDHDGHQRLSVTIPVNIDTLMRTLYTKSKFMTKFREHRKLKNVELSEWDLNEDNSKTRTVKYTIPIRIGPKFSNVTEVQVMKNCSEPGRLYSIDVVTWNEGIPYSETFHIAAHHCLVRTADDQTILTVYSQVKFKKPLWGLVRTIIEKNANDGMDNYYADLLKNLQAEFCTAPSTKAKRHRRAISRSNIPLCDTINVNTNNQPTVNVNRNADPSSFSNSKLLTTFIIILMITVLATNTFLLIKFWSMENRQSNNDRIMNRFIDFKSLNLTSRSPDDWVRLLQHQEELHADEITQLHSVLEVAIQMLKNTEKTLIDLLYYLVSQEQKSISRNSNRNVNDATL